MPFVVMNLAVDARKLTDFGIGTYVGQLLRGLAPREDVKLTVLARAGHEERIASLAPGSRIIPVTAKEYSVAEHITIPALLWGARIDLVHIPHFVVPFGLRRPVVATIHDVIQLFYPPKGRTQLGILYLRAVMGATLRRARRVITVSRTSRRDLVRILGADPSRLDVVPNGVDSGLGSRPPADDLEEIKTRFKLRPPLVLVVANDKPHKNLDTVLRAYHLAIRTHGIPGQLVFVGGVNPDSRLARRAQGLGLEDRVRFVGRVAGQDLHGLYHTASVLLHTALYEGFGLPVLEAMLAGLPVITSNVGAMQELGEGVARLVNPLDVNEMARVLEEVMVDDPLRLRMVEAGRRRASRLTWEKMVEGTMEVYRTALGNDRRVVQ